MCIFVHICAYFTPIFFLDLKLILGKTIIIKNISYSLNSNGFLSAYSISLRWRHFMGLIRVKKSDQLPCYEQVCTTKPLLSRFYSTHRPAWTSKVQHFRICYFLKYASDCEPDWRTWLNCNGLTDKLILCWLRNSTIKEC